jgi:hypothetical protein
MPSIPQQLPAVLTSWKEIASYLGKGVRTVQRWEVQLDLPVRRPNGGSGRVIQASREDLDRWLATRWSRRPAEGSESVEVSRDLRREQRRLVFELSQSLSALVEECESIRSSIKPRNS